VLPVPNIFSSAIYLLSQFRLDYFIFVRLNQVSIVWTNINIKCVCMHVHVCLHMHTHVCVFGMNLFVGL